MTDDELIAWAQQIFGAVLIDDTERANADLSQLEEFPAWWIAEKAERLMVLAKIRVEELT